MSATAHAAEAFMVLQRLRAATRLAEMELERAIVAMNVAGVPKTRVCERLRERLVEDWSYEPAPGDGLSAWTIRNLLDSGRHR